MKKFIPFMLVLVLVGGLTFAQGTDESNKDSDSDKEDSYNYSFRFPGPMRGFMLDYLEDYPDALTIEEPGILVVHILEDSAAQTAGIIRGDVILTVDGTEVNSMAELQKILQEKEAGQTVQLGILRGGQAQTLEVSLETRYNRPILGLSGIGQIQDLSEGRGYGPGPLFGRMMHGRR